MVRPGDDPQSGRDAASELDELEGAPSAEELQAAEALRQALEHAGSGGPWPAPLAALEEPLGRLRRSAAPELGELDRERVRRRFTDELARRTQQQGEGTQQREGTLEQQGPQGESAAAGATVTPLRGAWRRTSVRWMALAASLLVVAGAGLAARQWLPSPGRGGPGSGSGASYATVFKAPFDRAGRPADRLEQMIAWRQGLQGAVGAADPAAEPARMDPP